jgi:hypothetical protein
VTGRFGVSDEDNVACLCASEAGASCFTSEDEASVLLAPQLIGTKNQELERERELDQEWYDYQSIASCPSKGLCAPSTRKLLRSVEAFNLNSTVTSEQERHQSKREKKNDTTAS